MELINLAKGYPSEELLPDFLLQPHANQGLAELLQYGEAQGDSLLRDLLAQFLSQEYQALVLPEHLMITAGSSQGLDLICRLFTQRGDTVFIEDPSYFLTFPILQNYHLKVVTIATDDSGIVIDDLFEKLQQHRPKFLYTIPTFHNPHGSTLDDYARTKLVEIAQDNNFLIVADEVYYLLWYQQLPPKPMPFYGDNVISLGSFSKILAPGLRLGWIQATPHIIHTLLQNGVTKSGGGFNRFTSGIVRNALVNNLQQQHLQKLRNVYRERANTLSQALQQNHIGQHTPPQGGFFIWLKLPANITATQLQGQAQQLNFAFLPGNMFSPAQNFSDHIRLSFSYCNSKQLLQGAQRLQELFRI